MCLRTPLTLSTKTEREALEESLSRVDALAKEWCEDGQRIIRAARKYLDTLPKPPRKVKVTQYAVMVRDQASPWIVKDTEAEAYAYANSRLCGGGWRVVPLTGEYEQP